MNELKPSIDLASTRLKPYVRNTPLESSPVLGSERVDIYLKLECFQHTRSFKVRGALNKLLSLNANEAERGVVTASTGNHGLAVAFGLELLGLDGTIYLPETASPRKIELLMRQGASLAFWGQDSAETEAYARQLGKDEGRIFISPYNDLDVIAGQGTIGVELLEQLPEIDTVFVPVGGGGMIAGIASFLKNARPDVRIIGCLPEKSPVMFECVQAGRIVEGTVEPTLSDGTAGGVEEGAITFDICQVLVDDWVLVSESEIREGMQLMFDEHALVIEGAAGVSVAACQKMLASGRQRIRHAAVILCGSNVEMETFRRVVF